MRPEPARPGRGLPTTVRIWAAAVLCLLPLGTTWSMQPGLFLPTAIPGTCDPDTGSCTPDLPTGGILVPGSTQLVSQSPARVVLIFAAAALCFVGTRMRTPRTRTVARLACAALALAAALAAGHAATTTVLCALAALALVAPPAWRQGHRESHGRQRRQGASTGAGLASGGGSA